MSKKNPFLAHQSSQLGTNGLNSYLSSLSVQDAPSGQIDVLAKRFPPKYRPQAQIKFGRLPMAEAENMASNMTVSNPGNPLEER